MQTNPLLHFLINNTLPLSSSLTLISLWIKIKFVSENSGDNVDNLHYYPFSSTPLAISLPRKVSQISF